MANKNDLPALQELYLNLHDADIMPITSETMQLWENILGDSNYYILIGEELGKIVSSVTVVVIKNLTMRMRPHALIENMVTLPEYRNKGYAGVLLQRAVEIAKENNCYRAVFISGAKNESTIRFYANAGFVNTEKSAWVMKF